MSYFDHSIFTFVAILISMLCFFFKYGDFLWKKM